MLLGLEGPFASPWGASNIQITVSFPLHSDSCSLNGSLSGPLMAEREGSFFFFYPVMKGLGDFLLFILIIL